MTGLEKITARIRTEADTEAEKKLADAKKEAERISAEAAKKAVQLGEELSDQIKNKTELSLNGAKSAAQLKKRQILLSEKQRIIVEIVEEAKTRISALPAKEYFGFLTAIAKKNALSQPGEVIFSVEDKGRVPAAFTEQLSAAAGAQHTIAENTYATGGGFILRYGGIEVNCTLPALFYAEREALADKVQSLLFDR